MQHHFTAEKTYRYYTHGDIQKATKLLVVFHGYGQLAEFFIRKFTGLSIDYFIVAPEGMHRFYLNGVSGRVGASWMTKEDRETDIADNLHWLSKLLQQFENKSFEQKIILGFSQGGATAARFYYHQTQNFDRLVLWASVFPPDLKIEEEINENNKLKNTFVIGNQDEYFKEEEEKIKQFYTKLHFTVVEYQGIHDIEQKTLLSIL